MTDDRSGTGDRDDEGFLARWSRRKRHGGAAPIASAAPAATGAGEEAPVLAPLAPAGGDLPVSAAKSDLPRGDESADGPPPDLPTIESLGRDSDYTAFMRQGVPEALRRQALRKLWRSDPLLANLDGLNDYDENFAAYFEEAISKTVKTAYRVGKGFVGDDDAVPPEAEEIAEADETAPSGDDSAADGGDGDDRDSG